MGALTSQGSRRWMLDVAKLRAVGSGGTLPGPCGSHTATEWLCGPLGQALPSSPLGLGGSEGTPTFCGDGACANVTTGIQTRAPEAPPSGGLDSPGRPLGGILARQEAKAQEPVSCGDISLLGLSTSGCEGTCRVGTHPARSTLTPRGCPLRFLGVLISPWFRASPVGARAVWGWGREHAATEP